MELLKCDDSHMRMSFVGDEYVLTRGDELIFSLLASVFKVKKKDVEKILPHRRKIKTIDKETRARQRAIMLEEFNLT